jgi:hypothetical protein
MKKIFVIILVFISSILSAQPYVYYVAASGGDDAHAGTNIAEPWATWQKAFNTANAGDTVYFRGGTWLPTVYVELNPSGGHGNSGTHDAPICFFNYPGEVPILDGTNLISNIDASGFDIRNATNIKLRGLTVRHVEQKTADHWVASMQFGGSGTPNGNIYLDRVNCYSGGGYGIWFGGYDTLYLINCDSYDHYDPLGSPSGGRSDGFQVSSGPAADSTAYTVITGCRAWGNSDDGFEISTPYQLIVANNWAWNCGFTTAYGEGSGFKYAYANLKVSSKRKTYNNIAAFMHGAGSVFENLNITTLGPVMELYNNVFYRCRIAFESDQGSVDCATGFVKTIYRNNIAFQSTYGVSNGNYPSYFDQAYLTLFHNCTPYPSEKFVQDHNTWITQTESPYWLYNPDVVISTADFHDLDSTTIITELSANRHSDGSLPDITTFRLANDSDLRGAGVDVGMSDVPDMGIDWAFYDQDPPPPPIPVTDITVTGAGSATTITTNNGTLQMSAAVLPVDADLQTVTWSIADGIGHAHISVGGLVLAITDGTVTVRATANDGSAIYDELELTLSNQTAATLPTVSTSLPTANNIIKGSSGGNASADGVQQ